MTILIKTEPQFTFQSGYLKNEYTYGNSSQEKLVLE